MTSRGDWHWTGHLHNSGFVGLGVVAAVRLNFVDGAGNGNASKTSDGHVDGTSSTGDERNFSWDQSGQSDVIRDNWDQGVAANGITTRVEVGATVGDVISILFSAVIIVGTVIFFATGGPKRTKTCPPTERLMAKKPGGPCSSTRKGSRSQSAQTISDSSWVRTRTCGPRSDRASQPEVRSNWWSHQSRRSISNHPGFETVTDLLEGAFYHKDSRGNCGRLGPSDVPWMTAGSGVVHSEMPAAELVRTGGRLHGYQLWPLPHKLTSSAF